MFNVIPANLYIDPNSVSSGLGFLRNVKIKGICHIR